VTRGRSVVVGILVSVSAALTYQYVMLIDLPTVERRMAMHRLVVEGQAPSPYRYRVLVPHTTDVIVRALTSRFRDDQAFLLAYALYDFVAFSLLLFVLFWYLREWFSPVAALLGVLFVACTMPVAFDDHYFQPWSWLEVALFSLGLFALVRKRDGMFAALVLLASLNRETGLWLALAHPLTRWSFDELKHAPRSSRLRAAISSIAMLAIWAGIFLGLRQVLGSAPHVNTLAQAWASNTTGRNLLRTGLRIVVLFGAFGVFAVAGFRHAPDFVRRTVRLVPFWLALVLPYGLWWEVRLLVPLYPIVVPLALAFVFPRDLGLGPATHEPPPKPGP